MADVFISYARADRQRVAMLVDAIKSAGWSVWWDPEISPGQEFDTRIEAELQAARAVVVVWTPTSVASRWVRGEARDGADRNVLVPVRFEQAQLPIDVRAIYTTDLDGWSGTAHGPIQEVLRALEEILACDTAHAAGPRLGAPGAGGASAREPPVPPPRAPAAVAQTSARERR